MYNLLVGSSFMSLTVFFLGAGASILTTIYILFNFAKAFINDENTIKIFKTEIKYVDVVDIVFYSFIIICVGIVGVMLSALIAVVWKFVAIIVIVVGTMFVLRLITRTKKKLR